MTTPKRGATNLFLINTKSALSWMNKNKKEKQGNKLTKRERTALKANNTIRKQTNKTKQKYTTTTDTTGRCSLTALYFRTRENSLYICPDYIQRITLSIFIFIYCYTRSN